MTEQSTIQLDSSTGQVLCQGLWDLDHLIHLQTSLKTLSVSKKDAITINGQAVTKMDTAGAWLLTKWIQSLEQQGIAVAKKSFSEKSQTLLTLVEKHIASLSQLPSFQKNSWVTRIGKFSVEQYDEFRHYLTFVGKLSFDALRVLKNPLNFRFGSMVDIIDKTGFQALAIIALLSFMIGVVIAYQMGFQLRNYGANVFIVDLLGLSMLREFGPLLSAIMIAGRTGSSFTAQLGLMQANQEIDALSVMGVTPGELLLLPRLVGLFIALPLLTLWSDMFGIIGGMIMANNMLGVTWVEFLHRFQQEIPVRALLIGLGKAPVFALIIASIGCFQGIQVKGSSDSIGTHTTRSVVLAIFFIIVVDALFSIIFSKLRL